MKVKVRRLSSRLLEEVAAMMEEGLHVMLRKHVDKTYRRSREYDGATRAVEIMFLHDDSWSTVTAACAQTALRWAMKHDRRQNSAQEQQRLAFNLAKRLVKEVRRLSKQKRKHDGVIRLYAALETAGFQAYREGLEPLAQAFIQRVTLPEDQCVECRFARRKKVACPQCEQAKCAFHCRCTAGKDHAQV